MQVLSSTHLPRNIAAALRDLNRRLEDCYREALIVQVDLEAGPQRAQARTRLLEPLGHVVEHARSILSMVEGGAGNL